VGLGLGHVDLGHVRGAEEEQTGCRGRGRRADTRCSSPAMTEKDGGRDGGGGQSLPPPRSYSEFMRNLAAKYNGENPAETAARAAAETAARALEGAARAAEQEQRLQQPASQAKPAGLPFPQGGSPFPFPPFLFPPATSLTEASLKDPASFPTAFLQGLRPPGLHPAASLLDPAQAQALLTMMRSAQVPPGARLPVPPGIPMPSPSPVQPPPAKKQRRSSSSVEEPPVSPPASQATVPPMATTSSTFSSCLSLCASTAACSPEGRALLAMDTDQVMDFVRGVAGCEEYAELFSKENIDGAVLALLTDSHLQGLGMKLGPALRLRAALAKALGNCPHCRHCRHCHGQEEK